MVIVAVIFWILALYCALCLFRASGMLREKEIEMRRRAFCPDCEIAKDPKADKAHCFSCEKIGRNE